eukprot:scaffold27210_cov31-Attheya_sp.AAC.4
MAPGKNNKASSSKKGEAPASASPNGSPSKPTSPAKNMGASPPGRKSGKNIRKSAKLAAGWYIRSRKVDGGFRLVYVTLNTLSHDAYIHTAVTKLDEAGQDGAEDHELYNCSL